MGRRTKNKGKGKNKREVWRPRILVLEGLGGSDDCVVGAGGVARVTSPSFMQTAFDAIEFEEFDGMLLTGGGDVDPREYGQKPCSKVYGTSPDRDLVELYALEVAKERKLPVLGICRGAQIMGVSSGGILRQHIEGHRGGNHPVAAYPGTTLDRAIRGERMHVVSLHHQEVETVGAGWRKSGIALDTTCEAIESLDGLCLGVQFHPEMDSSKQYARNLFRWLIETACDRAGKPAPDEKWDEVRNWYDSYNGYGQGGSGWASDSWYVPAAQRGTRLGSTKTKGLTTTSTAVKQLKRGSGRSAPVKTTWLCPKENCLIVFDDVKDRDDHAFSMHGMETTTRIRAEAK